MRLMRSTPLLLALIGCLAGSTADAASPRDPFAEPAAMPQTAPEPLPDPFAAQAPTTSTAGSLADPFAVDGSRTTPTVRSSGLKDPFEARAPDCPVRTTDEGIVIQRPSQTDCSPPPAPRLPDPWARDA